jgi:hypothetical protein
MKKLLEFFVIHVPGLFYLLGIIVTIIQTSCVVYVPNVINTPLLSDKGEFQINLNVGESGFDPQLSAAVSDHVGIMLNGSFRFNNSYDYGETHSFIEAGAGYFTKFEDIGRFELFGGIGSGNLKAINYDFWNSPDQDLDVKTFRMFLQPDIGLKTNYFDASFAPRLVWLNLDLGTETSSNFFIEPAVTFKAGPKNIKLVFQIGASFPTGKTYENFYDPLLLSFGIQGTIGRKNNQDIQLPSP